MKTHLAFTARIFGTYAAILAIMHGVFEIRHGNAIVKSISINAIGNGCAAEQIWHACFPAMTIWPTYFAAGLITIVISLFLLLYVHLFFRNKYAALIIGSLAVANLLSGGGFIPAFTTLLAAAAILINRKTKYSPDRNHNPWRILWIISLSIYLSYAAGGWLLGSYFNAFMVENAFLLFFSLQLLLPILSITFARITDIHIP